MYNIYITLKGVVNLNKHFEEKTRIVWEDGKIGTFTFEEIVGETGKTIILAKLKGYKIKIDRKKVKNE
jgi:hypothetical protein